MSIILFHIIGTSKKIKVMNNKMVYTAGIQVPSNAVAFYKSFIVHIPLYGSFSNKIIISF